MDNIVRVDKETGKTIELTPEDIEREKQAIEWIKNTIPDADNKFGGVHNG